MFPNLAINKLGAENRTEQRPVEHHKYNGMDKTSNSKKL